MVVETRMGGGLVYGYRIVKRGGEKAVIIRTLREKFFLGSEL